MNFKEGKWNKEINVSDFIKNNITRYDGDESFLVSTSDKTKKVWSKCCKLLKKELELGVLDIDTDHVSGINNFKPGYIDKENEVIVGLQTDEPLKRMMNPFGGLRMVKNSLKAYNYKMNPDIEKYFPMFTKSHNDGVYDAYTDEIKLCKHVGLITGLPDAYGRGRIIGDYRRIALYGIDYLIEEKKKDLKGIPVKLDESIRLREEVSMQIKALEKIKEMALSYGFDISLPAKNSFEAVEWLYLGYLASVKENNGAAMSLGRVDAFLDIYFEHDLKNGLITEDEVQELIDQFVIKLRLVRHLRTPEYDELFSGDPTWVTASIGGCDKKGRSMVTKTSFRLLHTLTNLDPAPEPNMTVLWSENLSENFKKYCARMSIQTDAIQYENDDLMRPIYGVDYAIACCVSAMELGKNMQFFGARCNMAKALLYSINGGFDEIEGVRVLDNIPLLDDEILNYEKVKKNFYKVLEKTAKIYVDSMNIIHYMHDRYAYEASQMALHDTNVKRLMAYGVAGLSVVVDSLSAIKYAKVKPIRNEQGIAVDFSVIGDYPRYGNDNDQVDNIARDILKKFYHELSRHETYRNSFPTMSILTITSNVVYGHKTGTTPDGRKSGEAFAPGANPMHGRDKCGALASLNSVSKLDYINCCRDGISNTFTIIPTTLGKNLDEQVNNLCGILDGYFLQGAHHLNVNVLTKELLIDAKNNPLKYPLLTIRVSGYSVRFNRLTDEQKDEVIKRTFHEVM
ncbi:MAG: formate C-acetyltransferase [Bacilli bacterium]|nr:formate C-acetyltransferase [Bacilli bacterium]